MRCRDDTPRILAVAALVCAMALSPTAALAAAAHPAHRARTVAARRATTRKPAPKKKLTAAQRAALVQQQTNAEHAIASYAAMQHAYYNAESGLYPQTDAWPYSQAMAATISVAALPGEYRTYEPDLVARLSGLQAYADHVDPPPAGYVSTINGLATGGARFNDDNEWIGIELLRLYHLNHQTALLTTASGLLEMVYAQWEPAASPCPGGVPWENVNLNQDRNTVSNATGAELGAQLYLTTRNPTDLAEAVNMYNWVRGCLLQANGLYGDHITGSGTIDPTEWTYNQGTMIGAGVMLYQATHNAGYLDEAEATANAAIATFTPPALALQPESFNAIYIRNLLLLSGVSGIARYEQFAQWFANDAWYNVRNPATGLFMADPGGQTQLLDQAALVQVFSLLAEPTSAYF